MRQDKREYVDPVKGKLIFLDFDGPMNTYRNLKRLKEAGLSTHDKHGHLFDPEAVKQLERIVSETGAKIVVSSTWRCKGFGGMLDLFVDRGINAEVLDVTPDLDCVRGCEIRQFLSDYGLHEWTWQQRNYVIIDDDSDMLMWQAKNFVKTPGENGLTKELADKAIEILNSFAPYSS